MGVKFILVLVLLLALSPCVVDAKYITLVTNSKIENGTIEIWTVNKGDEAAYNVKFSVKVGNASITSDPVAKINPNMTFSWRQNFSAHFTKPGTYPLAIMTQYQDENFYSFSAVTLHTFNNIESSDSDIVGVMGTAKIVTEGAIETRLVNKANEKRLVTARVLAPDELMVSPDEQVVELGPKEEKTITFEIKNLAALMGSKYSVYTLAEYENEKHHLTASTGQVMIVEKNSIFFIPYWAIYVIIVFLVIVFSWLQRKK